MPCSHVDAEQWLTDSMLYTCPTKTVIIQSFRSKYVNNQSYVQLVTRHSVKNSETLSMCMRMSEKTFDESIEVPRNTRQDFCHVEIVLASLSGRYPVVMLTALPNETPPCGRTCNVVKEPATVSKTITKNSCVLASFDIALRTHHFKVLYLPLSEDCIFFKRRLVDARCSRYPHLGWPQCAEAFSASPALLQFCEPRFSSHQCVRCFRQQLVCSLDGPDIPSERPLLSFVPLNFR